MKKSYQFFAWIILVIVGLMVVLVITQINSSSAVDQLVMGNKQAAATLVVNHRVEEIVNASFELESKLLTEKPPYLFQNRPSLNDSINNLLLKANELEKIMQEAGISSSLKKIVTLVNQQTALSSDIVLAEKNQPLLDSLRMKHFGDSVYSNALAFQIEIENTLGATLNENNHVAKQVSGLNKLLAIIAMVAILLLGTIIIRRQVIQFILIRDLQQARELALQSVKVKDQFLANMSHEIRTPLNALKGFSQLLLKTALDKEQQQFTQIIGSSSESLLELVNDILDLSKLEAGAWSVKNKRFSLYALLKDLELTYAILAKEKNLAFNLQLTGVEDDLYGDPQRLRQVLVNLISNAVKFTNQGSVTLQVTSAGSTKNDETAIRFAVSDTGIGIPRDKLEVIFERFEQIDNSFIRQQGGSGLGLAITKMIVESMKGNVAVQSEPEKGSVFSFTLSFKIGLPSETEPKTELRSFVNTVTNPESKAVLLAEDNKVNQLLIQKFLLPFNVQPVIVENGLDVLTILERQHFDVILMDVQMPLMDGITATTFIRKNLGKTIPVIGMTAYVQPNEINKCYEAGMNEFVPKPIDEHQFLRVLKKYIYLEESIQPQFLNGDATMKMDLSFLEKICNGNKTSMKIILETMKSALPAEREKFEDALSQKDAAAVRSVMHHLKSTISPLGGDALIAQSLHVVNNYFNQQHEWALLEEAGKDFLKVLDDFIEQAEK